MYIYIYTPVNAIVRLPHPGSGDSQGQGTFLAPSADREKKEIWTDINIDTYTVCCFLTN